MLEKVDIGGKGMNDKQLIETIKNIKEECRKHDACYKCIFGRAPGSSPSCQIMDLIQTLTYDSPCRWNMDKIERIIKYE